MNKFAEFFYTRPKNTIHKWQHYFEIYDTHFKKFIGKNPSILEIGVSGGGSLDMWNDYFDGQCSIHGVDITESAKRFQTGNIMITIGDQGDRAFWDKFILDNPGKFDIIIDDGGHTMTQQITTYEKMYDHMYDGGVYLCEDTHTSYWAAYGGGLRNPRSFIEYAKRFVDSLHAYHIHDQKMGLDFRKKTFRVSFYDSIVVLDRKIDIMQPRSVVQDNGQTRFVECY
jgi:hypothetical protein